LQTADSINFDIATITTEENYQNLPIYFQKAYHW
jgi:hypothetical protein